MVLAMFCRTSLNGTDVAIILGDDLASRMEPAWNRISSKDFARKILKDKEPSWTQ
jgi:hypothetical protein